MPKTASKISFSATASKADSDVIVPLPDAASAKLPSKGINSVEGSINGSPFINTLEPDGNGGHLLRMDKTLRDSVGVKVSDKVALVISPAKVDPEPKVPADLQKALEADPAAKNLWQSITILARREWIHWIASAKLPKTRQRRVDQTRSKLKGGKKRPCCFNYQSPIVSYEPTVKL